jgi:hypothetical protein
MIGMLLGILTMAGLFALFAAMRPADSGAGGCHACSHGDGSPECAVKCPLLNDPNPRLPEPGPHRTLEDR